MSHPTPPCRYEADVPLHSRAYYGIGGRARFMVFPSSPAECADLVRWNRGEGLRLAVQGSGSNTLFADDDFQGTVLSLEGMQRIWRTGPLELFVEAGAENTAVAQELLRLGISGGEWLYRLPGRIGGTVRMNARCFGGEISAVTAGVFVLSPSGTLTFLQPEEVFHGYKETSLMHIPGIVLGVLLRFGGFGTPEEIEARMQGHLGERLQKHHFDFPSCGSVFRNNYDAGRPCGRIFEELGFKGASEGGAAVSPHHANFIFNEKDATAADVLRLAGRMRAAALEHEGIQLQLELECIGRFPVELLQRCGVAFDVDRDDSGYGWSGILDGPGMAEAEGARSGSFPRVLLRGPLTGYPGREMAFPSGIEVRLEQLMPLAHAAIACDRPFIRWSTSSPLPEGFMATPENGPDADGFMDRLWEYGASELFIGGGNGPYLEFEASPSGQWLAIRFEGPRRRTPGQERPSGEHWRDRVVVEFGDGHFGMTFTYGLLGPFIEPEKGGGGVLPFQCCASSCEGSPGLLPWWNEAPDPPDFHRPERFFRVMLD
ncbi:UDP-N-acetylmuramate dehydrogenase [Pelodictyon luteolum]|uniref:UDP-N-acetylenolpyruvoylglucosamine reductase n=1 Tax=Chlorobium luteolum (strain DSM 273 / BCRC 81028 / 2530) TaxID=319225 RepID=Q3B3V5_CHLL3|nr:UDP-N-acetylmuramate dehydrogenase [Pelodictyon luteolum]ABB23976.1 UDP-N-acetylmuramate dehydrogenase [Pelodictyon luteolum DSM 273]